MELLSGIVKKLLCGPTIGIPVRGTAQDGEAQGSTLPSVRRVQMELGLSPRGYRHSVGLPNQGLAPETVSSEPTQPPRSAWPNWPARMRSGS